ncbi:hypothetical protein ACIA5D_17790 [Actinoplanes sp. NPDC051513]
MSDLIPLVDDEVLWQAEIDAAQVLDRVLEAQTYDVDDASGDDEYGRGE